MFFGELIAQPIFHSQAYCEAAQNRLFGAPLPRFADLAYLNDFVREFARNGAEVPPTVPERAARGRQY